MSRQKWHLFGRGSIWGEGGGRGASEVPGKPCGASAGRGEIPVRSGVRGKNAEIEPI